jgi:preprotein translocase subunit SecA
MYHKLSGMTGTAKTEEQEFKSIYDMDVFSIPTNKPMIRDDMNDLVYSSEKAKFRAVLEEIKRLHATGQPVLVGTISIEKSELLSAMLKKQGIQHNVLNAKHHQKEAEIISGAGQPGSVTISTNMAGRGTDIVLGEGVVESGGLHIIGTERHESRRIDNQLRGRAGRQGDPGSSQFFISLEDDLMRKFGSERMMGFIDKMAMDDQPIEAGLITRSIENAQKTVEGRNFGIRKYVLQYDDVMNKQREVIYEQRRKVLEGEDLSGTVGDMIGETIENIAATYAGNINDEEELDTEQLSNKVRAQFGIRLEFLENDSEDEIRDKITKAVTKRRSEIETEVGAQRLREIERIVLLRIVDSKWMDHIDNMEQLKQGINLRAYGQIDPVQAYTSEGFEMFEAMNEAIVEETVKYLFNFKIKEITEAPAKKAPAAITTNKEGGDVKRAGHISKTAPCPCGSGKKYKRCCGKEVNRSADKRWWYDDIY